VKIALKLMGALEKAIGQKEFIFSEDTLRLDRFFQILSDRYGNNVTEHLLPGGAYYSHYAITVNGVHIKLLRDIETELKDGDTVSVLTMVPGG
jgi:molybdopterin converting factor small subunit